MGGMGYPAPDEDRTPIAWRCEMDRKLHPQGEPSHIVYIEEIAAGLSGSTVKRHGYFIRRMIVCRSCRRTIGDFDPASIAGGTQETQE